MRDHRDEGLVLRTRKLGEADRIVTILTRHRGLIDAVAKGVRRTSSKFGARLEPFGVVDLQLYEGKTLYTVTQVELVAGYGREIVTDYAAFTVAHTIAEVAEQLTRSDPESAAVQLRLATGAIRTLSARRHPMELIMDSYLLRALAIAGWAPSFSDCAQCGEPGPHRSFSAALGGVVCPACRPPGAALSSPETIKLLGGLLAGDWPGAEASSPDQRRAASGIVAHYAQYHLERHLRSLPLVERNS